MSSLDNMHFELNMTLLTSFLADNMAFLLPIIILVVAVLLALLVIDGLTGSILKVLGVVLSSDRSSGHQMGARLSLDNSDGGEDDQQFD